MSTCARSLSTTGVSSTASTCQTEVLEAIEQAPRGMELTAVELLLEPYGITPVRPDG